VTNLRPIAAISPRSELRASAESPTCMLDGQDSLRTGLPSRPRAILTGPAWCLQRNTASGYGQRPGASLGSSTTASADAPSMPWRRGMVTADT
jgi:hypothetical protein